jgi:hypothetical protein
MLTMARRDIALTFRGRRGARLAALLIALAAVPAILRLLGAHSASALALQRAHSAALVKIYDREIARALLDCPPILVVVAVATFFFQPLFVLVAGSDRLGAEIESGSIRYWAVRVPRSGIVLGKTLGLWLIVSLVTLGVQAAITIVAVIDAPKDWLATLGWAAQIMVFSCISAVVYASLCTLLGVVLSRPRLVLALGLAAVFVLRVTRTLLREHESRLASLFPGSLDQLFLTAGGATKLLGVGVVVLWSCALLLGAKLIFERRAV